jgi:hypothetical protein
MFTGWDGGVSLGLTNHIVMIKPFDSLFADLEKTLKRVEKEQDPEKYQHGIEVIREKIERMRALGRKFLQSSPKEITYFRDVWPAFHARLFLYIRLYALELRREAVPADNWAAVPGGGNAGELSGGLLSVYACIGGMAAGRTGEVVGRDNAEGKGRVQLGGIGCGPGGMAVWDPGGGRYSV